MDKGIEAALGQLSETPRQTAHQAIAAVLRHAILSGAFSGEARLIQADIAAHFGVSNTPVREALRELATEGLVRLDPYRGAVVVVPTLEQVEELFELGLVLEPISTRAAVEHITDEQLAALREIHEQMLATTDDAAWLQLNRQFHKTIHAAAHKPRLAAILGTLSDVGSLQTALVFSVTTRRNIEVSNVEHAALIEAIADRDADRAERVMFEHRQATLAAVRAVLEESKK